MKTSSPRGRAEAMLADITPVLLTWNEAPNLARTLAPLSWAAEIVVVDSFSDDGTVEIARSHPRVRLVQREFDSHAQQWNFAVHETGIRTEWVLALDADYVLSDALVDELRMLTPGPTIQGYEVRFQYCIEGRRLRRSVYPPVTTLFRREVGRYVQDGHTQRLAIEGDVARLEAVIRHDDRKPLRRWLASQAGYACLEAEKLDAAVAGTLNLADRARGLLIVAPPAVFLYALFVRGTILDGLPGLYYALQRGTAELILSLHLIQRRLERSWRSRS
jgi:glycosyltransferase involved in cell wall biosynthesis